MVIPTVAAVAVTRLRRGKDSGSQPQHPAVGFLIAAWNEGDFSLAGKYVAPDLAVSANGAIMESTARGGPEIARQSIEYWRQSIPDIKMHLVQEVHHKDRVAVEFLIAGGQTSDHPDRAVSGMPVEVHGAMFLTLNDDKIVSLSTVFDSLALGVQTEAIEKPAWWQGRSTR